LNSHAVIIRVVW